MLSPTLQGEETCPYIAVGRSFLIGFGQKNVDRGDKFLFMRPGCFLKALSFVFMLWKFLISDEGKNVQAIATVPGDSSNEMCKAQPATCE